MNFEEVMEFIETAIAAKTGRQLTKPEKEILKAAWLNQTYNSIADSLYLSVGYIKDLAYRLWQELSDLIGQKVSKHNFRSLLEKQNVTDIEENDIEEIENMKENVLIVDDLIDNLRFLTEILMKQGYKVRSVTNGNMALKTIENQLPDVILLDIKMPGLDGYEICKLIKTDNNTAEIPIIFLSALDEVIDRVKAFEVGGNDYISKPFYPEEVIARIQTQITIRKQKIALQEEIQQHQKTVEIVFKSCTLLASLLNSSIDGIANLKTIRNETTGAIENFCFSVVNPAFIELAKKQRKDLIGKPIKGDLFTDFNPELFASIQNYLIY